MGLIYVDACLIIYAFEDHPTWGAAARQALASVGAERLAISPLVRLECLVAPMRSGNLPLQEHYEQGLAHFVMLSLSDEVYARATELRARFNLRTPDALHLAAAQCSGCDALWTNNNRLNQASRGLAVAKL